jgi:FdhD protein
MADLPDPAVRVTTLKVRGESAGAGARVVAEESAIAFVIDGSAEVVMMATPADLEDFAVGFALNEGIIGAAADIHELQIAPQAKGVELRLWLDPGRGRALAARRRARAGPTGCGLCGVESLADALRPPPCVTAEIAVRAADIVGAMAQLAARQELNGRTRAVHGAALWVAGEGLVAVREDVGRHNALDKLAGALARAARAANEGVVLLTSRVSVELVQKAAMMGAPILAAVSAPTALALRTAEAANLTVAGVVREDGLEVFTHGRRVASGND